MIELEKLIKEARRAAELSYSPYSHFRVGACVEVDGDLWYSGTNIENASYGLTICAERVAICKAVSHGHRLLKRVIVYAPSQEVKTAPCGACRQFIKEFADEETRIIEVCDTDSMLTFTMEELLPKAFGPNNLLKRKVVEVPSVPTIKLYGDVSCPSCKGTGSFRDDLDAGRECYCSCQAGQNLKQTESI